MRGKNLGNSTNKIEKNGKDQQNPYFEMSKYNEIFLAWVNSKNVREVSNNQSQERQRTHSKDVADIKTTKWPQGIMNHFMPNLENVNRWNKNLMTKTYISIN